MLARSQPLAGDLYKVESGFKQSPQSIFGNRFVTNIVQHPSKLADFYDA